MINQIGKPYQSTKGKPGRGLGLFFVVNVARKLGGRVSASNLPPARASRWSCRCRPSAWQSRGDPVSGHPGLCGRCLTCLKAHRAPV
jgi:signal transduction histidine kinase